MSPKADTGDEAWRRPTGRRVNGAVMRHERSVADASALRKGVNGHSLVEGERAMAKYLISFPPARRWLCPTASGRPWAATRTP